MKRYVLASLLISSLLFSGCEKTDEQLPEKCVQVKILDELCGTAVMQILDEDYFTFGVDGYQKEGVIYNHVFSTELSCADITKFQTLAPSLKGLVVNVKMLKQAQYDPACTKCAAVVPNAPAKWIPVSFSASCD